MDSLYSCLVPVNCSCPNILGDQVSEMLIDVLMGWSVRESEQRSWSMGLMERESLTFVCMSESLALT